MYVDASTTHLTDGRIGLEYVGDRLILDSGPRSRGGRRLMGPSRNAHDGPLRTVADEYMEVVYKSSGKW